MRALLGARMRHGSLAPPAAPATTTSWAPPISAQAPHTAVVFLHGDRIPTPPGSSPLIARLQQPAEVARVLAAKFPSSVPVVVVMPPRYEGDYACYDAWLPGPLRPQGLPPRVDPSGYPAARALHAALRAGGAQLGTPLPRLVVVGFSKAGLVLHQLLAELAVWQQEAPGSCAACTWRRQQQQRRQEGAGSGGARHVAAAAAGGGASTPVAPRAGAAGEASAGQAWREVLPAIAELHWLDAGANARGATHPTSPALFAALGRRCAEHAVALRLHGTPRQWHDPRRRWLGQEAAAMAAAAAGAGVDCTQREYGAGERPSLEQHFRVIESFEPV